MIKTVTITGADDSIDPVELVKLSEEFPFVEWGILVSRKQIGNPRFPSLEWLHKMHSMRDGLRLSMHLCGAFVREFMKGNMAFAEETQMFNSMFQRLQINTHGEPHEWDAVEISKFIKRNLDSTFIFQYDNVNTDLLETLAQTCDLTNIAALYDLSHGAGILPENWPKPLSYCPVGYAGGLGPENLEDQIMIIEEVVGDTPIWIDMETKVRSFTSTQKGVTFTPTGDIFDLKKVRACLETAKPFVK